MAGSGGPVTPHSSLVATSSVRLNRDSALGNDLRQCLGDASGRINDNEPYAAVDPRNPDRIIAVWQSFRQSGAVIQVVSSGDGGETWTAPRAAPINMCAGGPAGAGRRASDPWASFGPDGRAYVSAIAWTPNPREGPDLVSALVVVPSGNGGQGWETPVIAALAPEPSIMHDNLATTADPTRPATIYAATTRLEERGGDHAGRVGFLRSFDGGRTWQPIEAITPPVNGESVGAPQIVVDSRSGRLYAVYYRGFPDKGFVGVKISDDAGRSWSDEVIAARHVGGRPPAHPVTGKGFVLAHDIVQAVVSPVTGELLVAYADGWLGRVAVSVVRSPDGRRWSEPAEVSATSHTAWLPAIAVQKDGDVAVSYYEADFTPGQTAPRMRVMLRQLPRMDGPITSVPIEIAVASLEWPGDYHVLVATSDAFLAVYGAELDIFARLIYASEQGSRRMRRPR